MSLKGGAVEDRQRRKRNLEGIVAANLDALVCFTAPDVRLLTGYWPVMCASVAIMSREGRVCVIVPEDEAELAHQTTDAEIIPYKPETLERLTRPAEALGDPLRELAARMPSPAKIGLSLNDSMQAASYQSGNHFRDSIVPLLEATYPQAAIVEATETLATLRSIKSEHEIAEIRRGCALASAGFSEASRAVAAGRREDQVAADVNRAFALVAQDGFERGAGFFFCMSGPDSTKAAGAYARTRRRIINNSDLVMIHANTVGDGMWTDITRTYTAGDETAEQAAMRRAIAEARSAALAAIKPGAAASAIDKAARDVLASHGFGKAFKHAVGHGVGFAAADALAMPRLHPKSPDVLEAGMTFNIEPAIYKEGIGGIRHCDVVLCTETGAEVLTQF